MKLKVITGVIFTLLFIGMLTLAFNIQPVKASGTIYIRPDGSIDPPTAPISSVDNIAYTFIGDITDEVVVDRSNIIIDGNGYTQRGGLGLSYRSNVTIKNMKIEGGTIGIYLYYSSYNTISGNKITNTAWGILLRSSHNNSLSGNNVDSYDTAIELDSSFNNTLSRNKITNNVEGIVIVDSSNNNIYGNTMINNNICVDLGTLSHNNILSENNMTNSYSGVALSGSNNKFFHNNFIDNANQVHIATSGNANFWDDGYPSGGNYWSDHKSTDVFNGPYQNETGSDGILDKPYLIEDSSVDRYPLIFPFGSPHSPVAKFFTSSPSVPSVAGEPMTFNSSFSLPSWNGTHVRLITEYRWDFGDGNITSTVGYIIVHTYSLAGTYDVSLTVLDSEGFNSSYVQMIEVWMPTFISISTSSPSTFVGYAVDINGTLHDICGNGLENQTVVLFYTFSGANTWVPITSDTTGHLGNYYVKWIPPATGYFTIKAEWTGNSTHFGTNNTVSLSSIPYQNRYIFSVESNSTVSSFAFNTTDRTLSFTVSGPSGTKGYVKVTVAKSLVANITDVKVYLDGNQLNYTVTSLDDSWLLHFAYTHSTHKVTISLGGISTPFIETPLGKVVIYGIPITAIIILIVLYVLKKKQTIKDPRVSVSKQDCTANIESPTKLKP